MNKLNKSLISVTFIAAIIFFSTSCNEARYDSIQDILKRDSLELYKLISTFSESHISMMETLGRYGEQQLNWFRVSNVRRDSDGVVAVEISGNLNEWYDVEPNNMILRGNIGTERNIEFHNDFHSDTLNMVSDFRDILTSFRNIAQQDKVYLLWGYNRDLRIHDLTMVDDFVELLFYYRGEHYLLIYTEPDKHKQVLEYVKMKGRNYYRDLDIENRCEELYDGIYLIGFSSQENIYLY